MYEIAVIANGLIAFTLCYLGVNIDKKHSGLKLLLIGTGIAFLVSTSEMSRLVVVSNNAIEEMVKLIGVTTGITSLVLYITLAYFIIMFVFSAVGFAFKGKKNEQDR